MKTALAPKHLTRDDLSDQLSVYYVGPAPGGAIKTMWSYSHRTEPKKAAPLYHFVDCMSPPDEPYYVGFTFGEVERLLRRV